VSWSASGNGNVNANANANSSSGAYKCKDKSHIVPDKDARSTTAKLEIAGATHHAQKTGANTDVSDETAVTASRVNRASVANGPRAGRPPTPGRESASASSHRINTNGTQARGSRTTAIRRRLKHKRKPAVPI
jgi:hypothetical protein